MYICICIPKYVKYSYSNAFLLYWTQVWLVLELLNFDTWTYRSICQRHKAQCKKVSVMKWYFDFFFSFSSNRSTKKWEHFSKCSCQYTSAILPHKIRSLPYIQCNLSVLHLSLAMFLRGQITKGRVTEVRVTSLTLIVTSPLIVSTCQGLPEPKKKERQWYKN